MSDKAAERARLRQMERDLQHAESTGIWRVDPADDEDGVLFAVANRDTETGATAASSGQIPRAGTICLIRCLAQSAGLPDPWDGRTIR